MRVAIVTSMALPLPAVLGGGVEWLVQSIIDENEKYHCLDLTVIGIANEVAEQKAKEYKYTRFVFIPKARMFYKYYGYLHLAVNTLNYYLPYCKFLGRFFKTHEFDRIVVENNINLMSGLKKLKDDKIIFHLHNDTIYRGVILPKGANKIRKIMCVSNFIRNRVISNGFFPQEMVTVLPNCNCMRKEKVDLKTSELLRQELGIVQNQIVFLYSGRIIREKGVKELVKAFNLMPRGYNIKLLIAGGINYSVNSENEYLREVKNIANSNVIFTGYVPYKDIWKLYEITDVAIVPTLYFEDAAPLAVIEAISEGIPVIASDSGGIWDYLNDSCGIMVRRDNSFVNHLSDAMKRLYNSPELRREMGKNGQSHSKQFNTVAYYNNFCTQLTKIQ